MDEASQKNSARSNANATGAPLALRYSTGQPHDVISSPAFSPGPSQDGLFQKASGFMAVHVPMVITPAFAELTQHEPQTMLRVRTINRRFIRFISAPG